MEPDLANILETGSITAVQALYRDGRLSVVDAVSWHLQRIETLNAKGPTLNAVRELSTTALAEAAAADAVTAAGAPTGPLHGIAILLKDNIMTSDGLAAAAGALAFAGYRSSRDATIVRRLRQAGAIILGKSNMTELADYVSDVMPSAFSGAGGVVVNPHAGPFDRGQGSSVGSAAAVAAGFAMVAIGSETQNSIQAPAVLASVVGFKPSVGRASRAGIVPLVPSQDSPGPLARCVEDAAVVASVICGPDIRDAASLDRPFFRKPVSRLSPAAIRLGVPRRAMTDIARMPPSDAFLAVLHRLKAVGVKIVDPCDLPSAEQIRDVRSSVFRTEFKAALNAFLEEHPVPSGVRTLGGLIEWNRRHPHAIPYGQSLLEDAEATAGLDSAQYQADRSRDVALSRTSGIDAACSFSGIDALIVPMSFAAKCTGKAGAPVVALPAGAGLDGKPFGVTLFSPRDTDEHLLAVAAAIEATVGARLLPHFFA